MEQTAGKAECESAEELPLMEKVQLQKEVVAAGRLVETGASA
jgi:hypothetical protein